MSVHPSPDAPARRRLPLLALVVLVALGFASLGAAAATRGKLWHEKPVDCMVGERSSGVADIRPSSSAKKRQLR